MKLVSGICEKLTVLNFGEVLCEGNVGCFERSAGCCRISWRIGGIVMAMLEVKDLQVYYGMIQAIKGISFEVNQGEVIALIGDKRRGKDDDAAYSYRSDLPEERTGAV